MVRHLAWFNAQTGDWIGEWQGLVPAPVVPPALLGEARLTLLNAWLHAVQARITPGGAAYPTHGELWNRDAWDDCPPGGAVCLDVTLYAWPVGDFIWARFDHVDRRLEFPEMRRYLQVAPDTCCLDANTESPRPVRSTRAKAVLDITGTPLEAFYGQLFGSLVRRRGELVLESAHAAGGHVALVQRALEAAQIDLAVPESVTRRTPV